MSGKLLNNLRSKESEAKKKYQDMAADSQLVDLLNAPDVFTMAAMMNMNKMFFGRGNFKKAIEMLS